MKPDESDEFAEAERRAKRRPPGRHQEPGSWLMSQTFPDLSWHTNEHLVPEGLTLHVGGPKLGKSWLAAQPRPRRPRPVAMFLTERLDPATGAAPSGGGLGPATEVPHDQARGSARAS